MRWTWDPAKNRRNKAKHRLGFDNAMSVFDDPLAISRRDPYPAEERWQTIGMVNRTIVVVIHSWPDSENGGEGRIISARKADRQERKTYEEGEF